MKKKKSIIHIGVVSPVCGAKIKGHNMIREDLNVKDYKRAFNNDSERCCKRCLSVIRTGSHIRKRYNK